MGIWLQGMWTTSPWLRFVLVPPSTATPRISPGLTVLASRTVPPVSAESPNPCTTKKAKSPHTPHGPPLHHSCDAAAIIVK